MGKEVFKVERLMLSLTEAQKRNLKSEAAAGGKTVSRFVMDLLGMYVRGDLDKEFLRKRPKE